MEVLIPFRDSGCRFRRRNLEFSRRYWSDNGYEVVIAAGPLEGAFNLAAARNEAVNKSNSDTIVVMDADIIVKPSAINEAIALAQSTGRMVYPFTKVRFLARTPSDRVVNKNADVFNMNHMRIQKQWDLDNPWGCGYIISRDSWNAVGGQDERFVGYGGEDVAFKLSCNRKLGESLYVQGMAYHLWHPVNRTVTPENSALLQTYNEVP